MTDQLGSLGADHDDEDFKDVYGTGVGQGCLQIFMVWFF